MKVNEILNEAKRGEFVGKSITYHEYLVRQIGPFEWTVPHGTKKVFLNLKAAKKYIDTKLTVPGKVTK